MHLLAHINWLEIILRHMDIGPWGYVVLFGVLLMCGVGLPVPEDVPLIAAGMLVGDGRMNLCLAAVLAWCGIMGGDCILYTLGWRLGHRISQVPFIGRHVTLQRLDRAERLFACYGVGFVAIGRLFAGIRGAMVVAAGTVRFNFFKFIVTDALAAIVSGGMFLCIGYWFGRNREKMDHWLHEFRITFLLAGIAGGLALLAYIVWRSKQHKTISQVVIDKAATETPCAPVATPQK